MSVTSEGEMQVEKLGEIINVTRISVQETVEIILHRIHIYNHSVWQLLPSSHDESNIPQGIRKFFFAPDIFLGFKMAASQLLVD